MFDSIMQNAMKRVENQEFDVEEAKIVVVGVGGMGSNVINRLTEVGIKGAETVAMNTDMKHLKMIKAHKKVLLGQEQTRGLGAGGYPEIGKKAAEESMNEIKEVLRDADMVFLVAGMGGGTGTGAAPIIAEIAK